MGADNKILINICWPNVRVPLDKSDRQGSFGPCRHDLSKLCLAPYCRFFQSNNLWFASTKLCFRTLEFFLAPLVLFLPDPPQTSPSHVLVTKCSHFSLGPFLFSLFSSFLWTNIICDTSFNSVTVTLKSLEYTGSQQFI